MNGYTTTADTVSTKREFIDDFYRTRASMDMGDGTLDTVSKRIRVPMLPANPKTNTTTISVSDLMLAYFLSDSGEISSLDEDAKSKAFLWLASAEVDIGAETWNNQHTGSS